MSKRSEELIRQQQVMNIDAESVVERHPRSKFPILLIFVVVVIFLLFNYLSSNHLNVQFLTDATVTNQTVSENQF